MVDMKQLRFGLLTGATLIAGATFMACGGLNSNKVNIIAAPSGGAAGDDNGGGAGTANGGRNSGGAPAAGESGASGDSSAEAGAAGEVTVPVTMPGAPTVVSVSPADETANADPAKPVVLHFSEPLDPTTVNADSVQVKTSGGSVVPGTVSYEDAAATFTPKARFDLLETYTVNASAALKDVDGTALKAPFTSLFVVRDGTFGTEAELSGADATTLNNSGAQFASGDTHAIVVWSQKTGASTTFDVVARLYSEGTGWGDAAVLNTTKTDATDPVVGMNANGDAVVAWAQTDPNIGQAIVSRRLISGVWDPGAAAIDHAVSTMSIHSITAGISPVGTAHVIWTALSEPSTFYTLAQDRPLNGDWAAEPDNMQAGTEQMGPAVMAFDATDNGFALYAPLGGIGEKVYAERYLKAGTWGVSAITGSDADNVENISLALDGADGAMAIWSRDIGSDSEVMASSYAKLWSSPVPITGADKSAVFNTSLARGGKGFIATWSQSDSVLNLKASEFGTAWSTPLVLSSGNHSAQSATVAADRHGNTLALWSEASGGIGSAGDIWFSRLVNAGDKWSSAALVETTVGNFDLPHIAVLADGTAVGQWELATAPGISGKFVKGFYSNVWQ
jgi:hypothetical protein